MLMALGSFIFELRTVAFGSAQKNHEYRWSSSEVVGKPPVLQALGKGSDKCTLDGVVYHKTQPLNQLKSLAEDQKPILMVDGAGGIHGNWIIRQINETESYFDKFGNSQKVEFKVELERYSGEELELLNILRSLF